MASHLETCAASTDTSGASHLLIWLRIEDPYEPGYWIYVEMRADAALQHLDSFLRQLWLECCGHMSAFSVDHRRLPMTARVGRAFPTAGVTFQHEYDFGSTTTLKGRVLKTRSGSMGRAPVRLLARNDPPAYSCTQCTLSATLVCPYCPEEGLFCDTHASEHEHAADEAYLPVVNSPRMGVCGYTG